MGEVNVNWDCIPYNQRLHERTKEWWHTRKRIESHNRKDEATERFQPGGVCLTITGTVTHRIMQSGQDDTGLGRWCWTRIRGQGGRVTRIISVYRPVLTPMGPTSVYNQHRRYYLSQNRSDCPRELFTVDLVQEMQQWLDEGDSLIIGIDVNEDVRTSSPSKKLGALGLREIVTSKHGLSGPATYQRGSRPIDGLFASWPITDLQCGYLAFGSGLPSDHRLLWMDIPLTEIVGNISTSSHPTIRRLQCRDPRIVRNYIARYHEAIQNLDLPERVKTLSEAITDKLSPVQQAEWEHIDGCRVQAMRLAEQRCRKLRMGAVPWSPSLQGSIDRITFWQLLHKRSSGGKVSSRLIARLRKRVNADRTSYTLQEVEGKLREAKKHYYELKKQAASLRATWLEDLAKARADSIGGSPQNHLLPLRRREQQRTDARACRQAVGTRLRAPVTTVLTTNEQGQTIECTTQQDIEAACIRENISRFQQAQFTPFFTPPLSEQVDALATNASAQHIWDGTWASTLDVDVSTARVLQALQRPQVAAASVISTQYEQAEHEWSWSRAREFTACGVSQLHFGHFIAGSRDPVISQLDTRMAQIPFKTGYAPQRWRQGLDLAILKKPDALHVETLRTLLLMEPDYNSMNKLLAKRVMSNAERLNLLAPEQYGSRRHRSAAELAINKRLTFDVVRQIRHPFALCSLDAKSCYDRIVWPVASLALQRLGAPVQPVVMMLQTLQNMRHHIRTVHGTSTLFYEAQQFKAFHGVGQGNGAAPAIWAAVSTPLLNVQRAQGWGAHFQAPLSRESLKLVGFAFVDDTDLCQSAGPQATAAQLCTMMQQNLDSWSNSLTVTGGALVPSKSHWVPISFCWKDGKWRYSPTDPTAGILYMKDSEGLTHPVEQISTETGRRTLGVRLAPDGNNKDELLHLRQCCEEWSAKIRQSHLPRHLVWIALKRMLWPKLSYPLPATTFTRQQCEYIMAPAVQTGLSGSGIVRTFPRALVHGPQDALGLKIHHLHDIQGWAHVTAAIKHGSDQSSITGRLLRCSLQHLTLELGLPGAPLSHDYDIFGCLATDSWVKTLWSYLWNNELKLEVSSPVLDLARVHDRMLMEIFGELGYRKEALRALNRCRMFLKVVTLADIVTGCGRKLTRTARLGILEIEQPRIEHWPVQSQPSRADWSIWNTALRYYCNSTAQFFIPHPLGAWLEAAPIRSWLWSPSSSRLYRQIAPDQWVFHVGQTSRSHRSTGSRFALQGHHIPADQLPADLLRGVATIQGSAIWTSGFMETQTSAPMPIPTTMEQYLSETLPGAEWLVQSLMIEADESDIVQVIREDRCIGISDGSLLEGRGTASWLIASREGQVLLRGSLFVPGGIQDTTVLRSELAGIYALLFMLYRLTDYFVIPQHDIEIGCDNKSALAQTFQSRVSQITRPNFDLISAIHNLLHTSPHKFAHRHIPAHQDRLKSELDVWAKLNIQADAAARAYHDQIECRTEFQRIWGEPWSLWAAGQKFTSLDRAQFVSTVSRPRGRAYWEKKRHFPAELTPHIAWQALGTAMRDTPQRRRLTIIKLISGFSATGQRMKQYKRWTTDHCPRCGAAETAEHVMTCPNTDARKLWDAAMEDLQQWMVDNGTHPQIRDTLLAYLTTWPSHSSVQLPADLPADLLSLAERQAQLGAGSLFCGFMLSDWERHQRHHVETTDRQYHGRRWLVQLIKKLWDVAWDLWDQRNQVLHATQGVSDDQLDQEISEQMSFDRMHLPAIHRRWFEVPLQELLARPRRLRRAWLRQARIIRKHSEGIIEVELRQSRQLMHTWLSRGRNQ